MIERAAILSTGDEITTGKVVDTNANYIADKLVEAGIEVASVLTVGDVAERIIWAWQQAITQAARWKENVISWFTAKGVTCS